MLVVPALVVSFAAYLDSNLGVRLRIQEGRKNINF